MLVVLLQEPALRQGDLRCSVVPECRMTLAALVYMPSFLDTGCAALPLPVSVQLLELFYSTLQHQDATMLGKSVPVWKIKA